MLDLMKLVPLVIKLCIVGQMIIQGIPTLRIAMTVVMFILSKLNMEILFSGELSSAVKIQ
jgi:hypothetical protein